MSVCSCWKIIDIDIDIDCSFLANSLTKKMFPVICNKILKLMKVPRNEFVYESH